MSLRFANREEKPDECCKEVTTHGEDNRTFNLKRIDMYLADTDHTIVVYKKKSFKENTMRLYFVIMPRGKDKKNLNTVIDDLKMEPDMEFAINSPNTEQDPSSYTNHCFTFAIP
jgi:hypothetical protein